MLCGYTIDFAEILFYLTLLQFVATVTIRVTPPHGNPGTCGFTALRVEAE